MEKVCWLCGKNGNGDPLEVHHIFNGNPNRKLSTKYNAVVYLCGNSCHRNGKYAVHQCKETREELQKYGQQKVMEEQGWDIDEFRRIFGHNYL